MISLDKAVIAKMTKDGLKFEILVDPVKSMDFKCGKEIPVEDIIASEEIFEDSKKGLRLLAQMSTRFLGPMTLKRLPLS